MGVKWHTLKTNDYIGIENLETIRKQSKFGKMPRTYAQNK